MSGKSNTVSFKGMIEHYLLYIRASGRCNSADTVKWYEKRIWPFYRWCVEKGYDDGEALTSLAFLEYTVHIRSRNSRQSGRPLSEFTRRGHLRNLKRFGAFLERQGYTRIDPARDVIMPDEPRPVARGIPIEDVSALLRTAAGQGRPRELALLLLLHDSGARIGEAIGLCWKDVSLDERQAKVVGKRRKKRTIYFTEMTVLALKQYRETLTPEQAADDSKVFWTYPPLDRPLEQKGAYTACKQLAEAAGVKWMGFHAFRHAFGRRKTREGMPLSLLQQLMGHSSPATTMLYYMLDEEDLQGAYDEYNLPVDVPTARELGLGEGDEGASHLRLVVGKK